MFRLWLLVSACSALVFAQNGNNPGSGSKSLCEYSCPPTDLSSLPLAKRPFSNGFYSFYSIFECTYYSPKFNQPEHTCRYDKSSGAQMLGSVGDACPPLAVECPSDVTTSFGENPNAATTPMFSQEKYETPAYVELGRYLVSLKEHYRPN